MKRNFTSIMKNLQKKGWLLGFIFVIPFIFFLDWLAPYMYPSRMDDMGLALIYRLQAKIVFLVILNLLIPTAIDIICLYFNRTKLIINTETEKFVFPPINYLMIKAKNFLPLRILQVLMAIQVGVILSLLYYLINGFYDLLVASVDFLIGAPYILLLEGYALLVIISLLLFFLVTFFFLWLLPWAQWLYNKLSKKAMKKNTIMFLMLSILLFSRGLLTWKLLKIANIIVLYFGTPFNNVVNIMLWESLLLSFIVIVYVFPLIINKQLTQVRD
ncbi:MAG: hypothetical protein JW967_04170 [Dehalococcoidales bacterium]|nr:hypothetical protein [Dehalococcoidales bacterium]